MPVATLPPRAVAEPNKSLFDVGNDQLVTKDFEQAKFSVADRTKMLAIVQEAIDDVITVTRDVLPVELPEQLPVYFASSRSYASSLVTGDNIRYSPNETGSMLSTVPRIEGMLLYNMKPDVLQTESGIADIRRSVHAMALHAMFHPTINVSLQSVRNAIVNSLGFHLFGEKKEEPVGHSTAGFVTPDSQFIYFEDGLFDVMDNSAVGDLRFATPQTLLSGLLSIHHWQQTVGEKGFVDPSGSVLYPPNDIVLEGITRSFPESLQSHIRNLPSFRSIEAGDHLSCYGDDHDLYITHFEVRENGYTLNDHHSHTVRQSSRPQFTALLSLLDEDKRKICDQIMMFTDVTRVRFSFLDCMRKNFDVSDTRSASFLNVTLTTHKNAKCISLDYPLV